MKKTGYKNGKNKVSFGIHNGELSVKGICGGIGCYIYILGGAFHGPTYIIGVLTLHQTGFIFLPFAAFYGFAFVGTVFTISDAK